MPAFFSAWITFCRSSRPITPAKSTPIRRIVSSNAAAASTGRHVLAVGATLLKGEAREPDEVREQLARGQLLDDSEEAAIDLCLEVLERTPQDTDDIRIGRVFEVAPKALPRGSYARCLI